MKKEDDRKAYKEFIERAIDENSLFAGRIAMVVKKEFFDKYGEDL